MVVAFTLQSRPQRRPLGLSKVFASVAAAAALIASDDSATAAFQGLSRPSVDRLPKRFCLVWCNLEDGSLSTVQNMSPLESDQSNDFRSLLKDEPKSSPPFVSWNWMGTSLLATLAALMIMVAVYWNQGRRLVYGVAIRTHACLVL